MDQIVYLRTTLDTLQPQEFDLFCNNLYAKYNKRRTIIKSLFFWLLDDFKHNQHQNVLEINKIAKFIIDCRKKKKQTTELTITKKATQPLKINNLPSAILNVAASYLKLSEQSSLMRCTRDICTSLSIPSSSRIQELSNKTWFVKFTKNYGDQYEMFQKKKFETLRMTKVLTLCGDDELYNEIPIGNDALYFNKINKLSLINTRIKSTH